MITRPLCRRLRSAALPATLACVLLLVSSGPAGAFEVIIGVGTFGSFSHHTGTILCRVLERHDGNLRCSLFSSADQVDILTNVQGGSLDLALVDSALLVDASLGRGAFSYLDISYDLIRVVSPLYDVPLTLIVRQTAGITSPDQLPGKRVNAGPPGSLEQRLFNLYVQARGWSRDDFPIFGELPRSYAQDRLDFKQGKTEVLVHRTIHPDPDIRQLLLQSSATLIGMDGEPAASLVEKHPDLSLQRLGHHLYPSLTRDIATFGTQTVLVTSADLNDHAVLAIARALSAGQQQIRASHPALASFAVTVGSQWYGSLKSHEALDEKMTKFQ